MHPQVAPLFEILTLNTRLFQNSLDGVDDAAAERRPGNGTNNAAFIAVHILDARAYLARMVGVDYHHPFEAELEQVTSIDEMGEFPRLEMVLAEWQELSDLLVARVAELAEDELRSEAPAEFPVTDRSKLGGLAFLLQHESFHVGQLAFLRRYLGFGPMSYGGLAS